MLIYHPYYYTLNTIHLYYSAYVPMHTLVFYSNILILYTLYTKYTILYTLYTPIGEKQLESDKRQMKFKISVLNKAIDSVRRHRSSLVLLYILYIMIMTYNTHSNNMVLMYITVHL